MPKTVGWKINHLILCGIFYFNTIKMQLRHRNPSLSYVSISIKPVGTFCSY